MLDWSSLISTEFSPKRRASPTTIPTKIKTEIKIDLIENLGAEKIIYTHINGTEMRIKSAKNIKDKNITIYLPKDKLYLFDNNKNRLKTWFPSWIYLLSGHVAEWLRRGLQILLSQFDSGRGLHVKLKSNSVRC